MRSLALLPALLICFLLPSLAIAGQTDIVINELMYNPTSDLADDEFLELYNRGTTAVDLSGWHFTKGITFTFPAGTTLAGDAYLVVARNAAQTMSRYSITNVIGNYSGKLDNAGERVTLANASGTTIDTAKYSDVGPWPVAPDGQGPSLELVNPWAENDDPANWRASGLDEWRFVQRTGVVTGGTRSNLYIYLLEPGECLIDDISIVPSGGGSQYVRNGGFEAGLTYWTRSGNHSTSNITTGDSHSGTSCIRIVAKGIGSAGSCLSCATSPALTGGQSYTLSFWVKYVSGSNRLYSRTSNGSLQGMTITCGEGTPGGDNSQMSSNIPPFIHDVAHTPEKPTSSQPVTITAAVDDDGSVAEVNLEYNLGAGWTSMPMLDDGAHGDGAAGDGVYGATLPAQPSQTVVRYKIVAMDDQGKYENNPYLSDPCPNWGYFPYDNEITTALPLYYLYADPAALAQLEADPTSDYTVPCTFVADQAVYDGSQIGFRGQSSRWYPKKSLKVKFPKGNRFHDLKSVNLNACYADKSFLRERLSWHMFMDAGAAYCDSFNVRVHLNGAFQGLYAYVEQPNDDWLARIGRDDTGNLYKAFDTMQKLGSVDAYATAYEKKTNESEDSQDIISFITELNDTPDAQIGQWLSDHMIIDSLIKYQAAGALVHDIDQNAKNYYMYHDLVTDKWEAFIWDVDLTFGRNFELNAGWVTNDVYRYDTHPYFGTADFAGLTTPTNHLIDAFLRRTPIYQKAYLTKLHELTDTILTPEHLNPLIDTWVEEIRPEVALDRAKWGSYGGDPITLDIDYQKNLLKQFVLDRRNLFKRKWLLINPGWNWISFPKIPTNPNPAGVFGAAETLNKLYWWDPVVKTIEYYPDDFTTVEVGEGYLLYVPDGTYNTHYAGTTVPTSAFSIPAPEAGWVWVGLPREHDIALSQVSVRDNDSGVTRTAAQDNAAGADAWLNWNWLYWDSYVDTAAILGFSGCDDTIMHPWFGYRVWAQKRNLTILIPN